MHLVLYYFSIHVLQKTTPTLRNDCLFQLQPKYCLLILSLWKNPIFKSQEIEVDNSGSSVESVTLLLLF